VHAKPQHPMTTNRIFTKYCAQRITKITTDIFTYISATISRISLWLHTLLLPRTYYVRCQFGCHLPLMKGTLSVEHSTYFPVSVLRNV